MAHVVDEAAIQELLAEVKAHPDGADLLITAFYTAAHHYRRSTKYPIDPFPRSCIAYHGTHLENLHSIVHTGLQNLSGTRLQRTGANFGAGIYLSTNYDTAFSFCQPCPSWPRSRYGTKLRVLLVCEVDLDRVTTERDRDVASGPRADRLLSCQRH
ncbi:Poly [ADP-ribose] polymerase 6 [Tetrabaena socialis]|uniref:Poly [ADP-ribose] polymerase n=1 Tax=Tetrabaena socialis TaxID=47790 RepID=A0A2J8A222_9CHLO|nr:Poly [ADP-ribose] polymerase 6 [Tetrabaena socialis]|eukprot:PNH06576.1 Poly [ADP-ribose] polymerase 6 [Tetrabaena socialis]